MREVAIVLVANLNVHSAPGDTPETVIGEVKRGEKFDVLERRKGPKVRWLRIGDGRWIAELNTVTNERFTRVDQLPDRPQPEPVVIEQPARSFPLVPITLGFLAVLLVLMWLAW